MARPLLEVKNLSVRFGGTEDGRERLSEMHSYAVNDVSFEIGEGEVLGVVGESGSGKSVTSLAIMGLLAPQARVRGEIWFGIGATEGEQSQDPRLGPSTPDLRPPLETTKQENRFLAALGMTKKESSDLRALRVTKQKSGAENLLGMPEDSMRSIRGARIAMIFQEPMTALNPVMRVGDQIAEAVLAHSRPHPTFLARILGSDTKQHAWRRAVEAMRDVAIPDHERRARDYPHQLSGGMRQRVMIAMALVNRPQLLIADEPTTALDVTIQAQILELLNDLRRKFGLAMLFVSHDLGVVSKVADRVAVMYAGRIVETGSVSQVFAEAMHPYTRGLMKAVPSLKTERSAPLYTIEGQVPSGGNMPRGCAFAPRCELHISQCDETMPPLIAVEGGHSARCIVTTGVSGAIAR